MKRDKFISIASGTILSIYLLVILLAVVLPIIFNYPPQEFTQAIKLFGTTFSSIAFVALGVIIKQYSRIIKKSELSRTTAIIVIGLISIPMVIGAIIALWPPISGYPSSGYDELLKVFCSPAVCGFFLGFIFK
jgi:predicted permease